jgi:hypothetical protein
VFERLGDLSSAAADARDAIDREPDDWRNHLLLARLEAERGGRRAALAQLAEARRLGPRVLYLNPASPDVRQIESLVRAASPASADP